MTQSVIKQVQGQGSNQTSLPTTSSPASPAGPGRCPVHEFLHEYQRDMLSLAEQFRGLRHPAGADSKPRFVPGSCERRTPPGTVVLHLVPVPGSWPSTPERRLARLLKYALRVTGFRATRLAPLV